MVLAGLAVVTLLAGCRAELPPIRQKGAWLVVENQTASPWTNVSVTLNAYYRGVSKPLSAGGRLEAPLASFVTGLGQRFDTAREHVSRVKCARPTRQGNPSPRLGREDRSSSCAGRK